MVIAWAWKIAGLGGLWSMLPLPMLAIIQLAKVQLPSQARCLDPTEVAFAKGFYAGSLSYDDIYVSDGIGADNRPITIAVPVGSRWVVVLNMGSNAFHTPISVHSTSDQQATLIHELAHAWQSQHHPDNPMKFMWNCAMSQAEAAALTAASNKWVQAGGQIGGIWLPNVGEADAYSYVTGMPFTKYGGEQIAQQVEASNFYPTRLNRGSDLHDAKKILDRMKAIPPGRDPQNVDGLSTTKFALKSDAKVVWHDGHGLPVYP
jgi:hypothetical protein